MQTQTGSSEHDATHQEHPLGVYFKIWFLLFVLSACSYFVDYVQLQGLLRWSLIILFMLLKAGLIIAIFMHMMWERMALVTAILLPPAVLLLLVAFMALEADYTNSTRVDYMGQEPMGFAVNLTDLQGNTDRVYEDGHIPKSRGCPITYRPTAVFMPFQSYNLDHAVLLVSVWAHGFEGPDRRFIVVPL